MNKVIVAFAILFAVNFSGLAQEMTKAEKKEWSSKLKSMTPENFKKLVENKDKYKAEVGTLQGQVDELQAENEQARSEVEDYKEAARTAEEKARQLESSQGSAPAATAETESSESAPAGDSYEQYQQPASKGVVFKVQVGAFKSFDITKYFDRHQNFSGEVDADGTMKYTLGSFRDYWEADKFKKYMREMGVKGAWIVSYKDGKRVNIKDVLEGAI